MFKIIKSPFKDYKFSSSLQSISSKNYCYSFSTIIAISYFIVDFLNVEDSYTYFNRINYLSDGNIFIYYNGQIHLTSQIIAYLLSAFPPFFQVLGYTIYSLISLFLFIYLINKIIKNEYIILLLISTLGSFYPLLFYNLVNSIWTGLIITALVPIVLLREKKEINLKYTSIIIFFSCSQAGSIFTIPLYLVLLYKTGIRWNIIFLIFWIILFSIYILPNYESNRTDLISNLSFSITLFLQNPPGFFTPKIKLLSDPFIILIDLISFFGMILIFIHKIIKSNISKIEFAMVIFALGIYTVAFASKQDYNFYLGNNLSYFLPTVVVFIIFIEPYLNNKNQIIKIISTISVVFALLTFIYRYPIKQPEKFSDIKHLIKGFESNVILDRGGGWFAIIGEQKYNLKDCKKIVRGGKDTLFIFCDEDIGEVIYQKIKK